MRSVAEEVGLAGGEGVADLGEGRQYTYEYGSFATCSQYLPFPRNETKHMRPGSFAGDRSQSH